MKQAAKHNLGILVILISTLILSLLLMLISNLKTNTLDLSSSADGAAAYMAISDITLETNRAIEMGRAMYDSALPAIQKFASETLAFIQENRNKPADSYSDIYYHQTEFTEDYSNSMTHFDYFNANNWAARSESAEKQYNQLLLNPQISSQYQNGLRNLQQNTLINPYLMGSQSVR